MALHPGTDQRDTVAANINPMVAMRERAGEVVKVPVVRRRRSKPQKIESRSSGRSAVLAARAVAGRRGLICDGHFESEGITGGANHEGHRRPGRPTIGRAESGMAVASGPNGDGQVATALRRSRSLGLPVPRQAQRRISARQSRSTATVTPAGYANARFAVAQIAQDSNRGARAAGNPVHVG